MRITLAALVACACAPMAFTGELIVEPDQFQISASTLLMYNGAIQHESSGVGLPVFRRQIIQGGGSNGGPNAVPSYQQNYRFAYLFDDDPVGLTNTLSWRSDQIVRSGNSPSGADRLAFSLRQLSSSFYLTESAVGNLSGFLFAALSDEETGGNRTAQARIRIWRLDESSPEIMYDFSESDENISKTLDWSQTFEPGHYLMTLSLETAASAGTPGDSASSRIVSDFDLTFASIPTPGTAGVIGIAGLCAFRRRR